MHDSASVSSVSGRQKLADTIQSFQTITTLLASIPKRQGQQVQVRNTADSKEASLKVANAIAILAAKSDEDVATAIVHENPLRPEVVICAYTRDTHTPQESAAATSSCEVSQDGPSPPKPTINFINDSCKPVIPGRGVTNIVLRETVNDLLLDYFQHWW